MSLRPFARLPSKMQNEAVRRYYNLLCKKKTQLICKRAGDVVLSLLLLALTAPVMVCIAAAVRIDSPGRAVFRQKRIARYNRCFYIYKFRSMREGAQGGEITLENDPRITRVGGWLRRYRLDELPQLLNILRGELSFVGPRPEVERYVARYDEAMMATLLMPAGLTSPATILFAQEAQYLNAAHSERVYCELLLPRKAALNLRYIESFSLGGDLQILRDTIKSLLFPCG
jgi:lipopolysaccharide/colanic/teichoic acid biosynthesis glycosyltransferase